MQYFRYVVPGAGKQRRLDHYLAEIQADFSRSRVQKLIQEGRVSVNGAAAKPKYRVQTGDVVELAVPPAAPLDLPAQSIPLNIVYEDAGLIVVDKPVGMVVHPAPGHAEGTLVNALLHHCGDLKGIGGVERPGIVHRLDKDTSGLVLAAKTEAVHRSLTEQFKDRSVEKVYLALVRGVVGPDRGVIDAPIGRHPVQRKKMAVREGGREAVTRYAVIARGEGCSYVRLHPKTGRTHQIRVHLASLGHPILGDKLYGGKTASPSLKLSRQALHAHRLTILNPSTQNRQEFESPLPEDMAAFVNNFGVSGDKNPAT